MDSKGKWTQGKRTAPGTQHEWNDNITDLSSMRLSKQEQAKKLMSRQSHNLAIAKAEIMDRNRHPGSPRSFSPSMSSKLRASGSKTVEEVLADGTAAIALAHKVRNDDMSEQINKVENYFRSQIHSQDVLESQKNSFLYEEGQREKELAGYNMELQHLQNQRLAQQKNDAEEHRIAHITRLGEVEVGDDVDGEETKNQMGLVRRGFIDPQKDGSHPYPLSPQGWQNLNNTIQLVVKTCEALWQQLEEERMTRQRLHFQLQEQRSVITTLTAELLQIQEHQDMILKELHASRSSSAPYQPMRSFPYNFPQQQQQQQQQQHPHPQQQQRFQSPLKGLPVSRVMADRLPPRTLAFSDSSIDAKQQNRPFMTTDQQPQPYRVSLHGKSKSVTQLDREHDLEESFHDPHRYQSRPGMDFLHDASVIDLLRNYRLSEG